MNSNLLQTVTDSLIAVGNPDLKAINFAIAIINLCLLTDGRDIDWQNEFRKSLTYIKEVLESYRDVLESNKDSI